MNSNIYNTHVTLFHIYEYSLNLISCTPLFHYPHTNVRISVLCLNSTSLICHLHNIFTSPKSGG